MRARELLRILSSAKQIKEMRQKEIMKARISETLEKKYVDWIDSQIKTAHFRNRSPAAEFALVKPLERERKEWLIVYRRSLHDKWHCGWCRYTHEDLSKVVEHENREHGGGKRE